MNYKILVVDDELDVGNLVKLFLQRFGCTVSIAGSGEEALQFSLKEFDLVITDMVMPEMNGLDLYDKICNDVKVMFMTGNEHPIPKGVVVLNKPFSLEELCASVEKAMNAKKR
jgi:CheY-like chemotaxis protein